jgi:hypothetical protein
MGGVDKDVDSADVVSLGLGAGGRLGGLGTLIVVIAHWQIHLIYITRQLSSTIKVGNSVRNNHLPHSKHIKDQYHP